MKSTTSKAFLLCLLACAAAGPLSGCNTVEGAGRDIEKVGEEIQEEAEDHD